MDKAQALRHALTLLANRPHSVGELRAKLLRVSLRVRSRARASPPSALEEEAADAEEPPAAAIALVVEDLKSRGLLCDKAYASWHASQRIATSSRPRSRLQLLSELQQRGVAAEASAEALEEHNELAACAAQARRREGLSNSALRKFLENKAFSRWAVDKVLSSRTPPLS
jgi:SOS response regulatory protein OraA/RecX